MCKLTWTGERDSGPGIRGVLVDLVAGYKYLMSLCTVGVYRLCMYFLLLHKFYNFGFNSAWSCTILAMQSLFAGWFSLWRCLDRTQHSYGLITTANNGLVTTDHDVWSVSNWKHTRQGSIYSWSQLGLFPISACGWGGRECHKEPGQGFDT